MGIWEQLGLDMARHRMVALVGAGGKTSTPVSYTHLDVYKRQAGGSAPVFRQPF